MNIVSINVYVIYIVFAYMYIHLNIYIYELIILNTYKNKLTYKNLKVLYNFFTFLKKFIFLHLIKVD